MQPFWLQLKATAIDGKNYKTDCTNTEGILRIVMSVPSPKVEPLKLWLAEQGKRTVDELNDPELLTKEQSEDLNLIRLMKQADRSQKVSREKVMAKLGRK